MIKKYHMGHVDSYTTNPNVQRMPVLVQLSRHWKGQILGHILMVTVTPFALFVCLHVNFIFFLRMFWEACLFLRWSKSVLRLTFKKKCDYLSSNASWSWSLLVYFAVEKGTKGKVNIEAGKCYYFSYFWPVLGNEVRPFNSTLETP